MCSIQVSERALWHRCSRWPLNGSEPDSIIHEKSVALSGRAVCDVCGLVGENRGGVEA